MFLVNRSFDTVESNSNISWNSINNSIPEQPVHKLVEVKYNWLLSLSLNEVMWNEDDFNGVMKL